MPVRRLAANPPATPASAAPPASSGVFAFEAPSAIASPAFLALETTDSRAAPRALFELPFERDFDWVPPVLLFRVEDDLPALAERFDVDDALPLDELLLVDEALRPFDDLVVEALPELDLAFPEEPVPLVPERDRLVGPLPLLPFELVRFFVLELLDRFAALAFVCAIAVLLSR